MEISPSSLDGRDAIDGSKDWSFPFTFPLTFLPPPPYPTPTQVESSLLKFLATPNVGMSFQLAVRRFNCNVNYSGLVHAVTEEGWFKENKEKLIMAALTSLLEQGRFCFSSVTTPLYDCRRPTSNSLLTKKRFTL